MIKYPFFKYITGESKVHLMNSKLKIIWVLLYLLSIILVRDYVSLLIISSFLFIIMLNTKISLQAYISNLFKLRYFYVLMALLMFLLSFNISFAIFTFLKLILLICLLLVLTFTTSLSEIAWGIECAFIKLKKIKVPVSKIALKIAMNIKFISTLFEQYDEIRKSMAYRGVPYNKKGISTLKKLILPVIRLSYKRSRMMAKAMKLRFYGSSKRRTNYHDNKVTKYDKYLILISIITIYIIIWLGWC